MEPQLPAPRPSQEMGAYSPQTLPPTPEALPQRATTPTPEQPAPQEQQPTGGQAQQPQSLPTPSQPGAATTPAVPILQPLTAIDENPVLAGDDEVIEKEWVDKAKKIVSQTKNDPYQQEKEVSKLQADYLKKRYGKEIKVSGD